MAQDPNVRFVRINGRIVPIKQKGLGAAQQPKQKSQSNSLNKNKQEPKEGTGFRKAYAGIGALGGIGYTGIAIDGISKQNSAVGIYAKRTKRLGSRYIDFVKTTWKQGIAKPVVNTAEKGLVPLGSQSFQTAKKIGFGAKLKNASLLGKQYARNTAKIGYTTAKALPTVAKFLKPWAPAAAIFSGGFAGVGYLAGKKDDKRLYEYRKKKFEETNT